MIKGVGVSDMTVSRRLAKEFRLKPQQPSNKPRLTLAMKAKHLALVK